MYKHNSKNIVFQATATASTYLEAVPEETMEGGGANLGADPGASASAAPTFHIPESNASDFAPSECSSHYRTGNIFW